MNKRRSRSKTVLLVALVTLTGTLLPLPTSVRATEPAAPEAAAVDPQPILKRTRENRPVKNVILKGNLYPDRRADPVAVELWVQANETDWRTIIRAGESEWLVIQPRDGAPRWFQKGAGELTGDQRLKPILKSQFTPYDLALPYLHWTEATYLGSERMKGRGCHLIEVRKADAPYPRVKVWIDQEMNGLLRAEAYDADGALVKRFWVASFRKLGDAWVPRGMEIAWRPPGQTLPSEQRSRIEVTDGKYDAELDPKLFDEQAFSKR